jgi:hypothetical protein
VAFVTQRGLLAAPSSVSLILFNFAAKKYLTLLESTHTFRISLAAHPDFHSDGKITKKEVAKDMSYLIKCLFSHGRNSQCVFLSLMLPL